MIATDNTSTRFARARLALMILLPVVVVVVVVLASSFVALGDLAKVDGTTADAGVARVGDDLALVIVTERSADISVARSLLINWGILAPSVALLFGYLLAWWAAGRVVGSVEAARRQVAEANEERSSQLQEVVHELRTPLAVMGANLELANYEAEPTGSSSRYISVARRAVGRMSRTVDDLAGHGALAIEAGDDPIDLARIAESVVEDSRGPAIAKGVQVTTVPMLPSVVVRGVDVAAVRTAADNFMTNAVRLAPQGSEIHVDCGEVDGWAWLAVSDEGPGLAPQYHARVFERGWQGPHDRDRQGGSGLGLTIARQLTEAQGGRTTVESEEGGGATFALWLPLHPAADADSVVASDGIHTRVPPWSPAPSSV